MLNELTKQYIEKLIDEFKRIGKTKWIESISNSHGSVGLTFEKKLNKKADSCYLPDFEGIELKCTTRYSNYPLYLFTIAFDGPRINEIGRIANTYGRYDNDFIDKKVLFTKVKFKEKTIVNEKYKFQLELNEDKKKIFNSIYNHYISKLNTLALIYASKKNKEDKIYFRYYKMRIYTCKSFDTFIKLLQNDFINVQLIARISKSGIDKGRYRNKNFVFSIDKLNVNKIFNCIYEYDIDKKIENKLF